MRAFKLSFTLFLLVSTTMVNAQGLRLPKIVSDGMVLQQKSNVAVWGWAAPNADVKLKVSWCSENFNAKADANGAWSTTVATPEASSAPQSVNITSNKETINLSDVLIGEVWLCCGQSNMQMPMRGFGTVEKGNFQPIANADQELATADIPNLRYFKVNTIFRDSLMTDVLNGEWWRASATQAREFSAVAFFFGRSLQQNLKIPIGLIGSSYGGTRIEAWMPVEILEKALGRALQPEDISKDAKQRPAVIYNAMVAPVHRYTIAGWCWFQGESNRHNSQIYAAMSKSMVEYWRAAQGDRDAKIPFYLVEIAPATYSTKIAAAMFREAQMEASQQIPNAAIVSTADIGDKKFIHFPRKREVGERLANLALARNYGFTKIDPYSPHYIASEFKGDKAIVEVSATLGKMSDATGFELAAQDGVFYPATASVQGKKIVVVSPNVPKPQYIRYLFTDFFDGQIKGMNGLPLHPFRTDK